MKQETLPRPAPGPSATDFAVLAGWTRAWTGVVVLAVVNGGLHRVYEQPLGELRAHQLSWGLVVAGIAVAPAVARTLSLRHAQIRSSPLA
jgi:hypothetical protein